MHMSGERARLARARQRFFRQKDWGRIPAPLHPAAGLPQAALPYLKLPSIPARNAVIPALAKLFTLMPPEFVKIINS